MVVHGRQLRWSFSLRSHDVLVNGLRLFWVTAIIWYEIGAFYWSVTGCTWPDKELKTAAPATHVLLVADPQVLDHRSYPGRGWLLMRVTQFIVDYNLRKSWRVTRAFKPQVIMVLGDMMDGGRYNMPDQEYQKYYDHYREMFQLNGGVPVHYLVGNHDVGLGYSRSFSPEARTRFQSHFGPLNKVTSIANHTFVLLDAPGLVEEDYVRAKVGVEYDSWPPLQGGAVEFVKNVASKHLTEPAILLTHIPMHRPDTASCGPLRERGTIRRGVGHGYQNTLGKQTTRFLLDSIKPIVVFSGDDHDYCEYTHVPPRDVQTPLPPIREVTVKSFSMAMGIKRPGFHLLSLIHPNSRPAPDIPSFADTPCLLPDQLSIYTSSYLPLIVLTLLLLFFVNISRRRRLRAHAPPSLGNFAALRSGTPDLEGGLHGLEPPFSGEPGWSPTSPIKSPNTPFGTLPGTVRSPYINGAMDANGTKGGAAPSFRAYSRPATPSAPMTPLDSPSLFSRTQRDEEEDDLMYPHNYLTTAAAAQANGSYPLSLTSQPSENKAHSQVTPYFVPAPNSAGAGAGGMHVRDAQGGWTYSWTFVLGGRRRRVTFHIPGALVAPVYGVLSFLMRRDRRSIASSRRGFGRAFVGDVVSVAWPPILGFLVLAWWTFR